MGTKNEQMAEFGHIRKTQLAALRRQIAKAAGSSVRSEETISCGIEEVNAALHGGLARGALHEIAAADHRSIPAALGFLLAVVSKISLSPSGGEGRGGGDIRSQKPEVRNQKTVHIQKASDFRFPASGLRPPPHPNPLPQRGRGNSFTLWPFTKTAPAFGQPYPPGFKFFGLDPARIVFVRCANPRECLWAMEEGLRLGGVAAVIGGRVKTMNLTASRRLQLVAEQANTPVFLLRNYNDHAPSAAVTRWRVRPAPSVQDKFGFTKNACFRVALEYARGGKTGEWVMEWNSDALRLRLSSALGNRAAGKNRAA